MPAITREYSQGLCGMNSAWEGRILGWTEMATSICGVKLQEHATRGPLFVESEAQDFDATAMLRVDTVDFLLQQLPLVGLVVVAGRQHEHVMFFELQQQLPLDWPFACRPRAGTASVPPRFASKNAKIAIQAVAPRHQLRLQHRRCRARSANRL